MNFFKQDSFVKKIIIAMVLILILNFSAPTISSASVKEAIGDFLLTLPDGLMWVMQSVFLGEGDALIKVKSKDKKWVKMGSDGIAWIAWNMVTENGEFNLPNIKYTPYAIFHNDIPILNADFFGDEPNKTSTTKFYFPGANYTSNSGNDDRVIQMPKKIADSREELIEYINGFGVTGSDFVEQDDISEFLEESVRKYYKGEINAEKINNIFKEYTEEEVIKLNSAYSQNKNFNELLDMDKEYYNDIDTSVVEQYNLNNYGNIKVNKIPNREQKGMENYYNLIEEVKTGGVSSVSVLKPIISKWYNILRTVAMVGLLSVLVYIGIRIVIYSASAQEKAKYKNMLKDWMIGLCLLFVLHFIMSFTMTVTGYIREVFSSGELENMNMQIYDDTECIEDDAKSKLDYEAHIREEDGKKYWNCNIVEQIRYLITSTDGNDATLSLRIAYTIMYIVIIIEVIIFTFQYIKRVITMAMLTLISPLIALTYPIDKITDGKAQGFNMWLKEYIFNALLQPMHLILYTIIISSAFSIIKDNPIYAIIALGCMTPMEKLLRKIFGFNKAESVGAFGGAAGAAVVMSAVGSLQKLGKKPPMGGKDRGALKDETKLWENKRSIDAEGELLGSAGDFSSAEDFGIDDEELANSQMSNSEMVNSRLNSLNGKLTGINPSRNKSPKSVLPNSSQTSSSKQTSQSTSVPIRNMESNISKIASHAPKIKRPRLYAAGETAKSYVRSLTRDISVGGAAKVIGKTAAKIATGAAVGTVGLAAGIASGDLGQTMKYTTTAATVGATLGGVVANRAIDSSGNIKETYQNARASADEDYATKKRYKEFIKNEQNMKYLESRYTNEKEREQVKEVAKYAAQYGITDVSYVCGIHEMQKQGYTQDQAIACAKMSKKMGSIKDPKNYKTWQEHLEEKYGKKGCKKILAGVEKIQKEID